MTTPQDKAFVKATNMLADLLLQEIMNSGLDRSGQMSTLTLLTARVIREIGFREKDLTKVMGLFVTQVFEHYRIEEKHR